MADLTWPHSLDAERSVFGAVLINEAQWPNVSALLRPEHFYRDSHQRMFRGLARLEQKRSALDILTLKEELERTGELDEVGGYAYISALVDGVPRSINVDHYARIVLEKAQAREVMRAAIKAAQQASSEELPIADVIGETVQALNGVGAHGLQGELVSGPDLAREAMQWLEEVDARQRKGTYISGFETGLRELDQMTDGLQPGDLVIVAGRPSQGKTALGLQIALNDGPTAFFSLEMQRKQLVARALATIGRIDGWALRRGRLSKDEYAQLPAALETLANGSLAIDDVSGLTVAAVRAKARAWQSKNGLKLIVVDYLTLLTPRHQARAESNRQEKVNEMTQGLKEIAKELSIPVLALAQLNRGTENRANSKPTLADLRESGSIEQIADVVFLIHRPDGETVAKEGEVQVIIGKQRNGPTGTLSYWWYPSQTRFGAMPSSEPTTIGLPV
jgi:replicative DNA helicase